MPLCQGCPQPGHGIGECSRAELVLSAAAVLVALAHAHAINRSALASIVLHLYDQRAVTPSE